MTICNSTDHQASLMICRVLWCSIRMYMSYYCVLCVHVCVVMYVIISTTIWYISFTIVTTAP